jgi:TRAP-type C4-dicarboxylate transport system permease small subunit
MAQYSPALNISMGHVYYALPLGGILIIIYSVLNIMDSLRNMKALSGTESA